MLLYTEQYKLFVFDNKRELIVDSWKPWILPSKAKRKRPTTLDKNTVYVSSTDSYSLYLFTN